MQRILIVEDEQKTGRYLQQGLVEEGYQADLFNNGRDGLGAASKGQYDLIILDVMLPFLDGWQIISALRESGHEEPVLFLTAKDNVRDKVKGLELGADDYLIKPFDFTELVARVRTGTVAKLAMRQRFVLFKGLTFQKLCLPGAFRPGDHHNKMLRPGLCVVHASPQYL